MGNYVKTPTIYQMEATECGAASLAMVFAYFGNYMPLEQMRIETGVSRDGVKAGNIMRAAKKYGLECHGYSKEPEFLKTVKPPCIIHWNFNHFVVFEGFKGGNPYINDPAVGRRKLTPEELDDCFTGIVLTFAPTRNFIKAKKKTTVKKVVQDRLKGQYGVIFKLLYIGMLLVFPGLILPVLSQVFLDDVLVAGHKDWLTKVLVFMGCCIALKVGLTYYRSLILQKLNSKMTLLSGYGFLRHMFRLPMSFFDQRYAGDLSERISNNTEVNTFLSSDLAKTVLNILTAIFYLIILFIYSPALTAIGLINTMATLIIVFLSSKALSNYALKIQMSAGKLNGVVCAGLSITDTIKASGAEGEYTARVLGYQAKQSNMEQRLNRFQETISSIPKAVGDITNVLMLLIGGILVIRGEITIGMLVAFTSLFDSFCEPVNELVSIVHDIQTLKANVQRVDDIESYPEDSRYKSKKSARDSFSKLSGDIELSNISFGYSILTPPLITNFNFKLSSGESIAFVGASGCGKSTVSKIVSGLYHPWEGTVLFDNTPIDDIERERLMSSISTVSQNIAIFSGSIRDNITLWNPAVLEEDIVTAAKDACIHDFIIKLPGGYDFNLEEGGKNLSGGQRQRIEIARALATKPTILVLDEATSALDAIVEKEILDNIKRRGCTCVVVAHRLSAIRDCNKIIVMHKGKIVQQGNHKTLMAQEGYYKAFVQNV